MDKSNKSSLHGDPLVQLEDIRERLVRIEGALQSLRQRNKEKHFYSTGEVAGFLGLSKWYVRRLCALGEIRAEKHPENGRFLIPAKELDRVQSRRDVLSR